MLLADLFANHHIFCCLICSRNKQDLHEKQQSLASSDLVMEYMSYLHTWTMLLFLSFLDCQYSAAQLSFGFVSPMLDRPDTNLSPKSNNCMFWPGGHFRGNCKLVPDVWRHRKMTEDLIATNSSPHTAWGCRNPTVACCVHDRRL